MTRIAYLALRWFSAVSRWLRRRFTVPGMLVLGAAWAGAMLGVDTDRSMSYQAFTLLLAALALAVPFAFRFRPHIAVERKAPRLLPANCLWYHANYVSPSWGRRLARNTRIGLHIFYS